MTTEESEILDKANAIVGAHGLRAEFLGDVMSVGVQGDNRTYTRVLCLIGPNPGNETLAALSTEITNTIKINRVSYELVRK